ncbi:MAG: hypothetical protein NT018_07560 [Armatimonadetes bacterium]|nr:hypothetical protein [Armatimonadota bacterium]
MNSDTSSSLISNASDLWEILKVRGGLQPGTYDMELEADLRKLLSLPDTGDFNEALTAKATTTEVFVATFFQAIQPYAATMADLLAMFEKAGATHSTHNLPQGEVLSCAWSLIQLS